jgi:hypothetical protein
MLSIVLIAAAAVGLSTPARAQLCIGSTSFAHAPLQLTGAAAFSADGKSYNAGLGFGGRGPFAQGVIGKSHYDEFDGSSSDLGFGVGYQIALDPKGKDAMHLCPLVSWQHGNGPKNVDVLGNGSLIVDLSSTTWVFGLSIGGVALSGPTQIVPSGSIAMAKTSVKASQGEFLPSTSSSENFAVFEFGIGFIFNQSFALRPSALITTGIDNTATAYGVSAVLSIVRRRAQER